MSPPDLGLGRIGVFSWAVNTLPHPRVRQLAAGRRANGIRSALVARKQFA